ncbi:hypothetical protein J7J00_12570 [Bacillus sp. ISL-4]|uniref:hypothetical protein n=1 Tax=Bacillus sp. ISL-4 TaxID=2819125 RepID=UPI001BEC6669|nr:hypothetical protein [Bacillus sp. ISL-4]MBT2666338.1 hypothetical protein [Bacillus sp. ISL-4]
MVLSKLDFPLEESLDLKSQATKYLDELAKNESNVETIIEKLVVRIKNQFMTVLRVFYFLNIP